MHLTVVCPACQNQYQVDPSLRGKRMRCPNTICRTIFDVREAEPQSSEPPVAPAPMIRAPATAAPKWSAPPPVRTTSVPAAEPLLPPDDFDIPGDIPDEALAPAPLPKIMPPAKKRGPWLIVGGLLAVCLLAAVVVAIQYAGRQKQIESDLAGQADNVFQKGDFAEAMKRFQRLQRDYPASTDFERYRFLATFSELRVEIDAAQDAVALAEARNHAAEFLNAHQDSPLFKASAGDVFEAFLPLAKRSVQAAQEDPDPDLVTQIESFWGRVRPVAPRPIERDNDYFRTTFAELRATMLRRARRQATLDAVHTARATPTAALIAELKKAIAGASLSDDAEIGAAMAALRDSHKASIAFIPAGPPQSATPADAFPIIPLTASLQPPQSARGADPVIALAPTGVVYALTARRGELLWAQRLGIDSQLAPRRLTGGDEAPRFLTVSNDQKTVALVDGASGKPAWQHVLSAPAASEPLVTAGHVLIPLVTGRLEDVHPTTGALQGSFQFDQPLPCGGATIPGTPLVALPGQGHCVYILDLSRRACVHIIESGHAAGSLVGPPIVVPETGAKSWLILTEAEPGPRIRLRPIAYPPETAGKRHEPDFIVPGTLSFPPRHDAESILLATEEGKLHRIGLRLRGNRDDLLFPLTPTPINLEAASPGLSAQAMVVHVDAENIWVMSAGRLQRFQLLFSPQSGPIPKMRWPQAPWLGDPLHAAQVRTDSEGTILFLSTHSPSGPAVWLSAVDGETGKVLWKTQLGSAPRGAPILADKTLLWSDGHRAYLAPLSHLEKVDSLPVPEKPLSTLLLKGPPPIQGPHALVIGWSPGEAQLSVSEIFVAGQTISDPGTVSLPAPLAAAPVTGDNSIVVALANGALCRIDLKSKTPLTGPDWRAPGADTAARTNLLRVRGDLFVAADGAGGLVAFEWGKEWKIARYRPPERRIHDPGVLLPGGEPRLLTVDSGGDLILLDVTLQPIGGKNWAMKGRATAGPFRAGDHVYVVVDGNRLVALDPSRDGVLWTVPLLAEVACAPQLVGARLIVADLNGNFWAFDPATGANLIANDRPAFSVRANLVPAASPVVLPDGNLFILWSDGTAGVVTIP